MRIAIIEPVGGHGGMDYYDFGLCGGLHVAGSNPILYTSDVTAVPDWLPFECKRLFKGIFGSSNKILRAGRYLSGLLLSLLDARRERCEVVHLHFFHCGLMELATVGLVKALGFRLVITAHDVESFSGSGSVAHARRIYAAANRVIVHNQVSHSEVVEKLGVCVDLVDIVPHGNYLDSLRSSASRAEAKSSLGLEDSARVVLFFGQIKAVKGLDLLLSAFKLVVEVVPNALLVIAGKVWKDDFSQYLVLINELGLSGNVHLDIRYISDVEAELYYKSAEVVALPYRKIYQSGVLLMAMSHERLVVTSDLPGMAEIVVDGQNGLMFPSGEAGALADKLVEALCSPSRDLIARRGHQLMKSNFAWADIGARTIETYRRALA